VYSGQKETKLVNVKIAATAYATQAYIAGIVPEYAKYTTTTATNNRTNLSVEPIFFFILLNL